MRPPPTLVHVLAVTGAVPRAGRFAVGGAVVNPGRRPSKVNLIGQDGRQRAVTPPFPAAGLADVDGSGAAVGTGTVAAGRRHAVTAATSPAGSSAGPAKVWREEA